MSELIKVSGNACGYILEELGSMPADVVMESKDFLDMVKLEGNVKEVLERVKTAISKSGYDPKDTEVASSIKKDDEPSAEQLEAIERHNKMNELASEPQEIDPLPKDFVIPKCSVSKMRIFYDLMAK